MKKQLANKSTSIKKGKVSYCAPEAKVMHIYVLEMMASCCCGYDNPYPPANCRPQ